MARGPERKGSAPFVEAYVERISSRIFNAYAAQITRLIGRRHGLYALYKGRRLYYVGLATDLRRRLKKHLRDRHAGRWDHFSLYLVSGRESLREVESLVLRIADPAGNRARGSLAGAVDLKTLLAEAVQDYERRRLAALLGGLGARPRHRAARRDHNTPPLGDLLGGRRLRAVYRGRTHNATVRRDGRIHLRGKLYGSLSAAARAITARPTNGWLFWRYRTPCGEWEPLAKLRLGRSQQP